MKWQKLTALAVAAVVLGGVAGWLLLGSSSPLRSAASKPAAAGATNKIATAAGKTVTNVAKRPTPPGTAAKAGAPTPATATPKAPVVTPRTNVAVAASSTTTNVPSEDSGKSFNPLSLLAKLRDIPIQYLMFGAFALMGLVMLVVKLKQSGKGTGGAAAGPQRRKAPAKAIAQCNVLQIGSDGRRLWQFSAHGKDFALSREHKLEGDEGLPLGPVRKDWRSLWQRKLNIAWLPPEKVFLRAIQLPKSSLDETLSMVELQLEKLSPIPVAQTAWSIQPLPHTEPGMQTVLVVIVARNVVEEFLGQLEKEGYLADRLEVPLIDELQGSALPVDGAWVYPLASGAGRESALVAWWFGGVLRNVGLVVLPEQDRAANLKEQLLQMLWAGELEGWLTAPPKWHLAASAGTATLWEPLLREAVEQQVEMMPPRAEPELAAVTATRSARSVGEASLLPAEYTARYHQQFVDRLWMGALGGVVGLYLMVVAVYFIAVQVALFRTRDVEKGVARMGPTYTNAMQLKAQFQVLKDRQELKYAGLDCWRQIAEVLPEEMTLDNFTFSDGRRLSLQGTAPMGTVQQLYQFEAAMRKCEVGGQLLFEQMKGDPLTYHTAPGGASISWSFALELKRSEVQ